MQKKSSSHKIVSVILAAGKGTRMQSPQTHKVCFSLEGRPVITRAIETYNRCGINSHFLVVGSMAEQVMQASSSAPGDLFFCYQTEQRGTGNAAGTAAKLLKAMNYQDDVLVVAGDKVIEEAFITRLIDRFYKSDCDLAFVVGDVNNFAGSGRIVCDENSNALGIVEVFDIARMQLLLSLRRITRERVVTAQEAESLAISYLKQDKKAATALGPLWDSIKGGAPVTAEMIAANFNESDFCLRVNERNMPPETLAGVRYANLSVYLYKAPALYAALDKLSSDNAQQEEYLTDTIGIMTAAGCKLEIVPIDYPEQVMAFNTPEELEKIRQHIESTRDVSISIPPKALRTVGNWLNDFEAAEEDATRSLSQVYGEGHPNVELKRNLLITMLKSYREHYGDEEVLIARAPGRVNVMGRHVDHQGGHINMIAIDKDAYMVIGGRNDRQVLLHNMIPHHFPDRQFDINELLSDYKGEDWIDFINNPAVREKVSATHWDWAQYIKASIARLQTKFPHRQLRGMNIVMAGDIPVAAGLSSSSAIVVTSAEGIAKLNDLEMSAQQFVELCGEAEWYVGTRGGAGDHASMKFARKGHVVQVSFFPLEVVDMVPFPVNHVFLVCNSHEKARKTAGARDIFNHRVACYNIGREIMKQEFPKYAPVIEHFRDLNTRNLGISVPELLNMLKRMPVTMDRSEVMSRLPMEKAERYLNSHSKSLDSYPIRSVMMYGIAECERSRTCTQLLRKGDAAEFGRWMSISHNGDRVVSWDNKGNSLPFTVEYSDAKLDELAVKAEASQEGHLVLQPGGYSCSIPKIDRMIDIALSVPGVMGAEILGAGLGGCMAVLVHRDFSEQLEQSMIRSYYTPSDLEPDMFVCYPVAGSGLISY